MTWRLLLAICSVVAYSASADRVYRAPRYTRGDTGYLAQQAIDSSAWIVHPAHAAGLDCADGLFLRFRRRFESDGTPLELDVSADERYVLFLDGRRIARGPARGTPENWLYDSHRLAIAPGAHVLEAVVWAAGAKSPKAQLSYRGGSFILKAYGQYDALLTTGASAWEVGEVPGQRFTDLGKSGSFGIGCQFAAEGVGVEDAQPARWVAAIAPQESLAAIQWEGGVRRREWLLFPSQLPDLDASAWSGGTFHFVESTLPDVQGIAPGRAFLVPANSKLRIFWNLGEYRCAYPELVVSGGKGAKVRWSWAESLVDDAGLKGDRSAWKGKHMVGFGDEFAVDGRRRARFTTPWWRCGLWCEVDIETAGEPLSVESMALGETRYPLSDEGSFESSDPSLGAVRSLCLRGLQMCAHDIVFDCPFFEQQMYPGDTRVQLLVHGAVSEDPRLVRRAMETFDLARRNDGMVPMNFPSKTQQESGTYTLCHAMMYGDYVMRYGADEWLKARFPGLAHTMFALAAHEDGDGILRDLDGWRFVDWVVNSGDWWTRGHPGALDAGPSAIENLFYVLALRSAALVAQAVGDADMSAYWLRKAERTRASATRLFWDGSSGMFKDRIVQGGPFSEHAQALAILADAVPAGEEDRHFSGFTGRGDLVRATVYFMHYVFDAYARRGRGELVLERMGLWRDYIAKGLTTPLESPDGAFGDLKESRSDCHGWGAHPIYHLQASVAGVRPAAPGFAEVEVKPAPGKLSFIRARVPHPRGSVSVDLSFADGNAVGTVELPRGTTGYFVWRGGRMPLAPGLNKIGKLAAPLLAAVDFRRPVLVPEPVEMAYKSNVAVRITAATKFVVTCPDTSAAAWVGEHASKWLGFRPQVAVGRGKPDADGDEGYSLVARDGRVEIQANALQGVRYALYAVRQIVEPIPEGRELGGWWMPETSIRDAPSLKFRAIHLCCFPETTAAFLERQIRVAAYYRFNYAVIESWGMFKSAKVPFLSLKDSWFTPDEARRLAGIGRDLGITLVPQFNVFGHATGARHVSGKHVTLDCYPANSPLFEPNGGWNWCLSNPDTAKVQLEYLSDMHEAFLNPPFVHIGCDEANRPSCARCRAAGSYGRLFADHVMAVAAAMRARGARVMMWHDMLLDHGDARWKGFYANGSCEEAELVRAKLPKDIVVCDWYYGKVPEGGDYPTLRYFGDNGFDVVTCPWRDLSGIVAQASFARKSGLFGMMQTVWNVFSGEQFGRMMETASAAAWGTEPPMPFVPGMGEAPVARPFAAHWRQCGWDMGSPEYSETGYWENQTSRSL